MAAHRALKQLVAEFPGFTWDGHDIVSATGARLPLGKAAKRSDRQQLLRVRQWLNNHAEAARSAARRKAHYADDGERQQMSGPSMAGHEARASLKRLDQMRELWPKMRPNEQVVFMREAAVDLAGQDKRYFGLRQVMGV